MRQVLQKEKDAVMGTVVRKPLPVISGLKEFMFPGADRMKQQTLLRAIRNGQRWMEMLINGEAKNITDLAEKLGLKPPYVTRVLGLNNLAPDIVEAIVNGAEPDGLSIAQIMKNIPEDWNEQRRLFGFPER